jgi:anoctamin-1
MASFTFTLLIIYCYVLFCRFDVDSENFFKAAIRAIVVDFILERTEFSDDRKTPFCFGVNRLVSEGVYSAAYPLHDVSKP